jgi:SAM-dependent methyltransferase
MVSLDLSQLPLDATERECLVSLLGTRELRVELELSELWRLMDRVWDDMGCDNRVPDWPRIERYYQHPVWLLNGLFIESDATSMMHRSAIAEWVVEQGTRIRKLLDFGGGFGTLASLIARASDHVHVDIYEPHAPRIGQLRVERLERVAFVQSIDAENAAWDCLVSTDVLEHVADPLQTLCQMQAAVRPGGYLLLANNFYPVIKCHLPATFHLRATFELFARGLGLARIGRVTNSHAVIYQKLDARRLDSAMLRRLERVSKAAFPVLDTLRRWGGTTVRRARAAIS